jgi:hypothetical protein
MGTVKLVGLGSSLHARLDPGSSARPVHPGYVRTWRGDDRGAAPVSHLSHLTASASSVT